MYNSKDINEALGENNYLLVRILKNKKSLNLEA